MNKNELIPIGTPVQMLQGATGIKYKIGRVVGYVGEIAYKVEHKGLTFVVPVDKVVRKTNKELYNEHYRNRAK